MQHTESPLQSVFDRNGFVDFGRLTTGHRGNAVVMSENNFRQQRELGGIQPTLGRHRIPFGMERKHVRDSKTKKGAVHYRGGYNRKDQALLGMNGDRSVTVYDSEKDQTVTLHPPVKSKAQKWGWRK